MLTFRNIIVFIIFCFISLLLTNTAIFIPLLFVKEDENYSIKFITEFYTHLFKKLIKDDVYATTNEEVVKTQFDVNTLDPGTLDLDKLSDTEMTEVVEAATKIYDEIQELLEENVSTTISKKTFELLKLFGSLDDTGQILHGPTDPRAIKVGSSVIITQDIEEIKKSFDDTEFKWMDSMVEVAGETMEVVEILKGTNIVRLKKHNGNDGVGWLYSRSIIKKIILKSATPEKEEDTDSSAEIDLSEYDSSEYLKSETDDVSFSFDDYFFSHDEDNDGIAASFDPVNWDSFRNTINDFDSLILNFDSFFDSAEVPEDYRLEVKFNSSYTNPSVTGISGPFNEFLFAEHKIEESLSVVFEYTSIIKSLTDIETVFEVYHKIATVFMDYMFRLLYSDYGLNRNLNSKKLKLLTMNCWDKARKYMELSLRGVEKETAAAIKWMLEFAFEEILVKLTKFEEMTNPLHSTYWINEQNFVHETSDGLPHNDFKFPNVGPDMYSNTEFIQNNEQVLIFYIDSEESPMFQEFKTVVAKHYQYFESVGINAIGYHVLNTSTIPALVSNKTLYHEINGSIGFHISFNGIKNDYYKVGNFSVAYMLENLVDILPSNLLGRTFEYTPYREGQSTLIFWLSNWTYFRSNNETFRTFFVDAYKHITFRWSHYSGQNALWFGGEELSHISPLVDFSKPQFVVWPRLGTSTFLATEDFTTVMKLKNATLTKMFVHHALREHDIAESNFQYQDSQTIPQTQN